MSEMIASPEQDEGGWARLSVPPICERMIGFSIPQDEMILVVSYEGMHLVRLGTPVTVETDDKHCEYDLYDADKGLSRYGGRDWSIIGLHGGQPILRGHDDERLVLNIKAGKVALARGHKEEWSSAYENFSGDWAAVTFSPDGRFIVLGCPYGFDFRVWERVGDAHHNR